MNDFNGDRIKSAGPSSPIEIIGIQDVPSAGDNFVVVENDKAARALVEHRLETERKKTQSGPKSVSLEKLIWRKRARARRSSSTSSSRPM